MKIIFFGLLSLVGQGMAGILYHRQHAAAVESGLPLTGRESDDYFGNHIFGQSYEAPKEAFRVIKITRTYAVPVPVPVPYAKEVPVPFAVPKPIPVPVPHPVPVPVHKAIFVPHPIAVPVPIDHLSPPATNQDSNYQDSNYQDLQYPQSFSGYSQQENHYNHGH